MDPAHEKFYNKSRLDPEAGHINTLCTSSALVHSRAHPMDLPYRSPYSNLHDDGVDIDFSPKHFDLLLEPSYIRFSLHFMNAGLPKLLANQRPKPRMLCHQQRIQICRQLQIRLRRFRLIFGLDIHLNFSLCFSLGIFRPVLCHVLFDGYQNFHARCIVVHLTLETSSSSSGSSVLFQCLKALLSI